MVMAILGTIGVALAGQAGTVISVIVGQTIAPALSPLANGAQHTAYNVWPNVPMTIGDTVLARYRRKISPQNYRSELLQQGIDDWRQNVLYSISENLLNVVELIALHRRGQLDLKELYPRAEQLKWSEDSVDELLKVSEAIPGATDIIAFAVREVYSPEIAEAFGQYEGGDAVYSKAEADLKAIGMSKPTFIKYWAAHWMLPSVGQGFEMVHRDVIPTKGEADELDLDKLMTALDIMPAWRDKLTAISYSPYTRVDVRRMHKLHILDDDDLIRAYMDLGYDEIKAQGMADFTIAYNYEPPENEQTAKDKNTVKERDLTKTDIMSGYQDALLAEGEVRSALGNLGYSADEIDYYISRIDYNREKDETDEYLKYYHDAYVRGIMDFGEITDKFGELNLASTRAERLFQLWDLEKRAKTNRPTKAELMTFLRKNIITDDVWNSEMLAIGYSPKYVAWYKATV